VSRQDAHVGKLEIFMMAATSVSGRVHSECARSSLPGRWRRRTYMPVFAIGAVLLGVLACSTSPKPKIDFSPSSITLNAVAGGSASGAVTVNNGGGGTLDGLGAAVGAYSTGASGWLTATLGNADAPAALNLVASAVNLPAGSYSAVVNVSDAAASPPTGTLTVNLTVTQ
jgi:hypothetical protein